MYLGSSLFTVIQINLRDRYQERSYCRSDDHSPETISTHSCQDRDEDQYRIDLYGTFQKINFNDINDHGLNEGIYNNRDHNNRIRGNNNGCL